MKSAILVCLLAAAASAQTLTFTKEFPRSLPPYASITVLKSGAMEYKESATDDQPVKAQLTATESATLFDLAEKLDYFKSPLESGLKVANTGKKTFRYDDGSGKISQSVFNYSTNPLAQQLLEKFEQISATERAFLDLERTTRFDKLGVNDALAEIESLWLKKQLAAAAQFLPLLNRVATHESFMHLARERAGRLRDEIQAANGNAKSASTASQ